MWGRKIDVIQHFHNKNVAPGNTSVMRVAICEMSWLKMLSVNTHCEVFFLALHFYHVDCIFYFRLVSSFIRSTSPQNFRRENIAFRLRQPQSFPVCGYQVEPALHFTPPATSPLTSSKPLATVLNKKSSVDQILALYCSLYLYLA